MRAAITVNDDTANSNQPIIFTTDAGSSQALNVDGSASDALTYNPSTQTLTVKNLTVSGTQTTNNVEIIETSNGIVFEGSTADANETTLTAETQLLTVVLYFQTTWYCCSYC